jgi:hypothetical protein
MTKPIVQENSMTTGKVSNVLSSIQTGVLLRIVRKIKKNIQANVFWVVTPCSVVVGYRRFRDPCCLHLLGCDAA